MIFVALYWVADRERIERLWLSLLSPAQRNYARNLLYQIEDVVGAHLRSQVVQYALALMLLIVGYSLLGMRYPWLLAWIASIVWFVPLIGGFLALIPAFLLGLIDGYTTALAIVIYTALIFMVVPLVTQRFRSLRQQQGSILGLMITIALIDVMGLVGVAMALPVTVTLRCCSHTCATIHCRRPKYFTAGLPECWTNSPPFTAKSAKLKRRFHRAPWTSFLNG